MKKLSEIIANNEEWLMARILAYAKEHDYTMYTSTLMEAWRLSISGLSESILTAIQNYPDIPELSPEEEFADDPVARFGIYEAQKHRRRGVPLPMFLGLMKYYRQSYLDLLAAQDWPPDTLARHALFLNRVFDRIEISFVAEWADKSPGQSLSELQAGNRFMTNEKNKYLTIFESIPLPVIILNPDETIDNMNLAAAMFLRGEALAGGHYYAPPEEISPKHAAADQGRLDAVALFDLLPWLPRELDRCKNEGLKNTHFTKEINILDQTKLLGVTITKSLDISDKFTGTIIIFEDLTPIAREHQALLEQEKLNAALETVGMVYHELTQPLQVILGMSEIMQLDLSFSLEGKEQLEQIGLAARKLASIINKLDKIKTYKNKPYVGQASILDLEESVKSED